MQLLSKRFYETRKSMFLNSDIIYSPDICDNDINETWYILELQRQL